MATINTQNAIKDLLVSKIAPQINGRMEITEIEGVLREQERVVRETREKLESLKANDIKGFETIIELIKYIDPSPSNFNSVQGFYSFIGGIALNNEQRSIYHGLTMNILSRLQRDMKEEDATEIHM